MDRYGYDPIHFNFFSFPSMGDEIRNVKEALSGDESPHYKKAMEEEMKSLKQNQNWPL